MNPRTTASRRPQLNRRRLVAGGLTLTTLALAGTGAAAVAAQGSAFGEAAGPARGVVDVTTEGTPELESASTPTVYTDEQQQAFWDAGFTAADTDALAALWQTDWAGVKAQAGQMLLDGQTVPIAPGSTPEEDPGYTEEQMMALWDAGYTQGDAHALAELWQTDWPGVKARAGQMLLDGQTLPIAPGTFPGL